MSKGTSGIAAAAAAGLLALAAGTAEAAVIQFSASGDNEPISLNGNPGTVHLDAKSTSIDLTPGVPQTVQLNLAWLDVTPAGEAVALDTLSQTLIVQGGGSRTISQPVQVITSSPSIFSPYQASALIEAGAAAVFDLGSTGTLTITPLGGTLPFTSTEYPEFDNLALFELVAPIPEPASGLLLLSGAGLLLARRRASN